MMAYNRVYDDTKRETLYTTREGLGDACDWMMARADQFDRHNVGVEEVQEDGEVTGWWSIDDLFSCNPQGWMLPDGNVIRDKEEA